MVALTLALNEEQLLAALDDGGLWGLDLTHLNSLPVLFHTPSRRRHARADHCAELLLHVCGAVVQVLD